MKQNDDGKLIGDFPSIPKQARAQQKKQALLSSGYQLFIENGYENTTAKEIAAHAGVATGTFYRYFSDKRQLLWTLLEDKVDRLMPPEPDWLQKNPEKTLSLRLKDHFEQLKKFGFHHILPELMIRDPFLAELLHEAKRRIHTRIYQSLLLAKDKGLTWNDVNLESVSWAIMSLIEKIPEMEVESGVTPNYDELATIICRMVLPPGHLSK